MYEGIFELFDIKVRRLQNGDKLSLVLEMAENLEEEKKIIEYRGDMVKVFMSNSIEPEDFSQKAQVEGVFEVYEIKYRHLKNGSKLRIVLESLYDKKIELNAVQLRFDDVKFHMVKEQPELDFDNIDQEQSEELYLEDIE